MASCHKTFTDSKPITSKLTSCLLCELLPAHHILLLIIDDLQTLRVQGLLQVAQIDVFVEEQSNTGCKARQMFRSVPLCTNSQYMRAYSPLHTVKAEENVGSLERPVALTAPLTLEPADVEPFGAPGTV